MSTENPAEHKNQVSIICRTLGRPELKQALQSIASQDYPNIEIVLVDATGKQSIDSAASGDRPLEFVTTGSVLRRSAAANAGLEAAHGKYIQFLDDDDWIDPSHVSQLVSVLESSDETAAAYSSTQKTNAAGDSLDYVFREAFDPILLMRDNYIPIHSILFDSALLKHGCRFDEAFDIYEDWDFWLQLSQHTNFQHIDSITAYYREGGDSDTALADVRLRYQADTALGKGRAAIFEKWLPKWTGEKVNSLIGQLDQSVLLCEQDAQIHSELRKNAELQHEIEKLDSQINGLDSQINGLDSQINGLDLKLLDTASQLKQLKDHSKQQAQHVGELEKRLNAIYDSLSWKLMGPVRRVSRTLTKEKEFGNNESDSDK
jgi:hypothetical protein